MMPGFYDEALYDQVSASNLTITPILISWVESRILANYSPLATAEDSDGQEDRDDAQKGGNYLVNAYLQERGGLIPAVGSFHPKYKDAVCRSANMEAETKDSTSNLRVITSWDMPGEYAQAEYDSYQQTIRTTFDFEHKLMLIGYKPTQTSIILPPIVATPSVPTILRTLRIIQYEIYQKGITAAVISDLDEEEQCFWNIDEWNGYAPGELLWFGKRASSEGTPLHRTEYTYGIRPETLGGWHHVFEVYVDNNGKTPADITVIDPTSVGIKDGNVLKNGAAAFRVLGGLSFKDYFPTVKPLRPGVEV